MLQSICFFSVTLESTCFFSVTQREEKAWHVVVDILCGRVGQHEHVLGMGLVATAGARSRGVKSRSMLLNLGINSTGTGMEQG